MSDNRGLQIIMAFFFVLIIGLYIGMDIQTTIDKSNTTQPDQFIFITYPESLEPPTKGVIVTDIPKVEPFIISSITPCSEPYYIDHMDSVFEVGGWVKSTSEYKRLLKNQFCGKIIDIDGDLLTVCVGGDIEYINKYWAEPWDCVLVMYSPDIGYFCSAELMIVPYNENTTYITKIYAN